MRSVSAVIVLLTVFVHIHTASGKEIWKRAEHPAAAKGGAITTAGKYLVFTADDVALTSQLDAGTNDYTTRTIIDLPMGDGSLRSFRIKRSSLIPPALAAKYPGLRTFNAIATDNAAVTAKLDLTAYGFHAMIFDEGHIVFIDPYNNNSSGYYIVHKKEDEQSRPGASFYCSVKPAVAASRQGPENSAKSTAAKIVENGAMLRTYRLALACDNQYAQAVTGLSDPAIAQVLSKMVTSMNRINGVYERELSITMNLVDNEDTLIWTTATGGINGNDPYNDYNDNAGACNTINQMICDKRIDNANYDLGHVFTTGAGGYSQVGVVCHSGDKAQSSTGRPDPVGDGFDIDFVAHEMGHEFGANHTFNNGIDDNCGRGNRYQPVSYEPGSGSTLMAYAGICSPDNIQQHSDDYFHGASLAEIQDYITNRRGNLCPVKTPTGNNPVTVPSFVRSYNIPYLTPFELTAPDVNAADTAITYCWEQFNLGVDDINDYGTELKNTHDIGPIFRSYKPVKSITRVFPNIDMVLAGTLSDAGTDNAEGEKAPDVSRYLTFKLTVRDIAQGYGTFVIPDDTIFLDAINTGQGFIVTSQNTAGNIFNGGTPQTVTWNVVSTDQFPINTPDVDIYMSADGGYTWPYHVGRYINNGSAIVTLPNPDTTITNARIKVKGADNVFFNVNSKPFEVVHGDITDTDIQIRPVPVRNTLRISSGNKGLLQTVVFNAAGQEIWKGQVNGELDMPVSFWARGVYIIRFVDIHNQRTVKKFVVE